MSGEGDRAVDVLDGLDRLVAEYESCVSPGAFTTERALYERLCHALGRRPREVTP